MRKALRILVVAALAGVTAAAAGTIGASRAAAGPSGVAGQVSLSGTPTPVNAVTQREAFWDEWNGVLQERARPVRTDEWVAVALVRTGPAGPPPADTTARIVGGNFERGVVLAAKGTKLTLENTDGCAHELFVEGTPAIADAMATPTAPGNHRTLTLAEAGTYAIKDALYAHVRAALHVIDGLAYTAPLNPTGAFSFANVAPGSYELRVYLGDKVAHKQAIDILDGRPLELAAPIVVQLQNPSVK